MSNRNLNKKIGQATKWSTITELVAKLITPIVNMVLARLLAPEAFGVVATITMVISFAEIFADAGFQKYIIQHDFQSKEDLDDNTNVAFWTNMAVSLLLCVLITVFRNPLAILVGSEGLGNSIAIASVIILIVAFSSIQTARYKRDFDFRTLFFVRIGSALIPLAVTIPLAIWLRNYWALLIGNFASQLFIVVFLTAKSKWKPKFRFDFKLLKNMFAFSAWTLLESIAIWLTNYLGVFVVGSVLSDYYLGLYKTSMSTVNSFMVIITGAITPVLFSALSRYQNDNKEFKTTYYTFQRITAIFVIPMGIGIYLFRDAITMILLGEQWAEASGFIGIWGLTSAFTIVLSHFSSEVYRSKGRPKISLIIQLVHILFLVPTLMLTVDNGFVDLYIARSIVRVELILSAIIVMRLMFGFKIVDILKNILPMLIAALIMGLVGYVLSQVKDALWWDLVCIVICIAVYFGVLIGLFPSVRKDIGELKHIAKRSNDSGDSPTTTSDELKEIEVDGSRTKE